MKYKHIRFDWAAKKMLRDKKNFDILEGFLSELLKEDIKIEGLLESEGNQKHETDKFNRVDLYAENAKGEHIIIEIQNTRELDYLMRMLYGTSKAISEFLTVGEPYSHIKKVIAISIIYFGLGKGEDYIYVGQTKFKGLHTKKELELTTKQQALLKQPTIHQAFPEYYLIQTSRFKDIIREPLDEWIYFFKNNEVKEGFRAKGMGAVREKLAVHKLSDKERRQYERFLDDLHWEASVAQTAKIEQEEYEQRLNIARQKGIEEGIQKGIEEGIQKGIEEGIQKGMEEGIQKGIEEGIQKGMEEGIQKGMEDALLETVKRAIAKGYPDTQIAELTDLHVEEIAAIRQRSSS